MREADIRPADILNEYLRLSAVDAETFFRGAQAFVQRACPGCNADDPADPFDKDGFRYVWCGRCGTLYANPAPAPDPLADFYRDSPSQRYWAQVFFPAVAEARRERIFRPRVARLQSLLRELDVNPRRIVDVGAGVGIFLEECRAARLGTTWAAVEPNMEMASACRHTGFEVFDGFAHDAAADGVWKGAADLVVSFEVIEHVRSPFDFLQDLAGLTRPGGLIVVSGLSGSGFDIAILGPASKAVSPPLHLNFLSGTGVRDLLKRCGLDEISFLTPGELDVDIVRNVLNETPAAVKNRFLRRLVRETDDETRAHFQRFLSKHGLSSHMWFVARRPS